MPNEREDISEDEPLLGHWIALDRRKYLVIYAHEAGLSANIFSGMGEETITSGRLATPQADGGLLIELGEVGVGTTYRLTPVIVDAAGGWRTAGDDDDPSQVMLRGVHGASFYEAVMGPWDDFVEELNAADAWATPPTLYRRPTGDERASFHFERSERG